MKLFFIYTFLWVLSSCNLKKKSNQSLKHSTNDSFYTGKEVIYIPEKEDYYKDQVFSEKLKGGYEIYYTRSKDFKNIYLRSGSISKKLNTLPINEGSYFSLGIVLNDFDDYVILGHDNGNSAAYSMELIEKKTAKNILGHEVISIEGKYNDDYLVYCDSTAKSPENKIVLFDFKSKGKQYFDFPSDFFAKSIYYNRSSIFVDTVTRYTIQISYDVDSGTVTKVYRR